MVHRHVGMEPSGRPFNEMCLDERAHHVDVAKMQFMSKEETASFHPRPPIPHNPMINAGAIMIASMLFRDQPLADRFDSVMKFWKDLVGCDDDSHASECPSFANSMCVSGPSCPVLCRLCTVPAVHMVHGNRINWYGMPHAMLSFMLACSLPRTCLAYRYVS